MSMYDVRSALCVLDDATGKTRGETAVAVVDAAIALNYITHSDWDVLKRDVMNVTEVEGFMLSDWADTTPDELAILMMETLAYEVESATTYITEHFGGLWSEYLFEGAK